MSKKEKRSRALNSNVSNIGRGGIEIIFYTDPLCCWSWAMQPQLSQIIKELDLSDMEVKYKMGGLLPSWRQFNDAVNSIQKPVQMGPEWMHARAVSGRTINDKIWITDPPASSFPACIAVKSVELQSPRLSRHYFNLLQEALMVRNQNIAKTDVLMEVASELANSWLEFDLFQFRDDLLGKNGKDAFRKDLQECKYLNIGRLPTILFRSSDNRSVLLSGYQTYESLKDSLAKIVRDAV